jgi:hypothetical protein
MRRGDGQSSRPFAAVITAQDDCNALNAAGIEEYRDLDEGLVIGGSTIAGAAHPAEPPKRLSRRPAEALF